VQGVAIKGLNGVENHEISTPSDRFLKTHKKHFLRRFQEIRLYKAKRRKILRWQGLKNVLLSTDWDNFECAANIWFSRHKYLIREMNKIQCTDASWESTASEESDSQLINGLDWGPLEPRTLGLVKNSDEISSFSVSQKNIIWTAYHPINATN
jgi:hypothetical protein